MWTTPSASALVLHLRRQQDHKLVGAHEIDELAQPIEILGRELVQTQEHTGIEAPVLLVTNGHATSGRRAFGPQEAVRGHQFSNATPPIAQRRSGDYLSCLGVGQSLSNRSRIFSPRGSVALSDLIWNATRGSRTVSDAPCATRAASCWCHLRSQPRMLKSLS